jgi:hypothetical protein
VCYGVVSQHAESKYLKKLNNAQASQQQNVVSNRIITRDDILTLPDIIK